MCPSYQYSFDTQIQCFLDFGLNEENIRSAYTDIPSLASMKADALQKKMNFYYENRLLLKGYIIPCINMKTYSIVDK